MIKRKQEDIISQYLHLFPVVAVLGPRQSGKTTLAKMIAHREGNKYIYLDMESPRDYNRFGDPEYYLEALMNEYRCIIIDEVQRIPSLFAILRSIVDRRKGVGQFLLLGSAAPELVRGVSESLAGRIGMCEVNPFGLNEFPKRSIKLNKHWFRGGYPDAWLAKSDDFWLMWMDNYFRTFIERDLNMLFGVNFSPQLMYRLWYMIAVHHGQIWNAQLFGKSLDTSPTTVTRYLEYLEGAYLFRILPAWHTNSKKRVVKSPKIYVRDSGLLHYLLNIHQQSDLLLNPMTGSSWEGYAMEQILQNIPRQIQPYFYRTHDGAEMDLVLVKGTNPWISIEFKISDDPKLSRGYYECISDLNTKQNFVITTGENRSFSPFEGTVISGLREFIEAILPKLLKQK